MIKLLAAWSSTLGTIACRQIGVLSTVSFVVPAACNCQHG